LLSNLLPKFNVSLISPAENELYPEVIFPNMVAQFL